MNNPLFRPPAEANSLILQIDQGCPHNRCTFCGMYRRVPYQRMPLEGVEKLVRQRAHESGHARRIFLADGDVMSRPFGELEAILTMVNASFPRATRVSVYANGSSIAKKTDGQLAALKALKLHTLYMGMESGSDDVLQACSKGETAGTMIEAGARAQATGLRMSVMILLGLGGQARRRDHVQETANALNAMQPRLLSALRVVPIEGTPLYASVQSGEFRELTEWQTVRELRDIIARLELTSTVFRANHSSNVIPIEARLPRDTARILAELDAILDSNQLDRETPGPRPLWL